MSAFRPFAICSATPSVVLVAEKYATSTFVPSDSVSVSDAGSVASVSSGCVASLSVSTSAVLFSAALVSALLSTEVSSVDGCSVWLAEFPQAASPKIITKESKIAIVFFIINTSVFYSAREKMTSSRLSRFSKTDKSEVTLPIGMTSTESTGLSVCA